VKWVFLIVVLSLMPAVARAQVFVNQEALVQLAGFSVPAAHTAPAQKPSARRVAHRLTHRFAPRPAIAMTSPAPKLVPPAKPVTPAPVPVVAKPVIPAPPPKPVLPGPLVIGFATGSASLPASAAGALKPFCTARGQTLVIDAYAPGDPNDPSAAMRLSMSRAFALRDALAACGVPGGAIIPRADGATGPNVQTARVSISGPAP
jgi:hypothetical protein